MEFTIKGLDWIVKEVRSPKEALIILFGLSPFLVFFAYIFLMGILSSDNDRACRRERAYSEQLNNGVILTIKRNKSSPTSHFELSDGSTVNLHDSYLRRLDYTIAVGDTLEKQKGELDILIRSSQTKRTVAISLAQHCNND